MKRYVIQALFAAGLLFTAAACDSNVKSDDATVGEAREVDTGPVDAATYQIDTVESAMTWVGSKVTGRHDGTIQISRGNIAIKDDKVVGGTIVIDMKTLQSVDKGMDEASNTKLSNHLKSADFFDVEQYPEATFRITGVEPIGDPAKDSQDTKEMDKAVKGDYTQYRIADPTHRVTGNLTLKDITKSISFPAKISISGDEARARANFNIDRRDWKISYGADQSLGDKMIYSDMNIGFDVVARKQAK